MIHKLKYPVLIVLFLCCSSCTKQENSTVRHEHPVSGTGSLETLAIDFYSATIQRTAHYVITLPPDYDSKAALRFPVLFLLHGMDGGPTDWIEKGHLAQSALPHHLVLVMPDGGDSYYTNSVFRSKDRYEDFITQDLVNDVEHHYRVLQRREGRGISGISMGGYAAIKIALRHPDEYAFGAGLSAPVDVTRWPFAPRRFGQSMRLLRIFGLPGGSGRRTNDVFVLAEKAQPAPYLYLACGTGEGLLGVNRSFDHLLTRRGSPHEYHESLGVHAWDSWNRMLPSMLTSAEQHLHGPE